MKTSVDAHTHGAGGHTGVDAKRDATENEPAKRVGRDHSFADQTASGAEAFSAEDRSILSALRPVVKGLAAFWGDQCEVLLHSLEDMAHSVVEIENGHVTGRAVGSPVTDLALQILRGVEQSTPRAGMTGGGAATGEKAKRGRAATRDDEATGSNGAMQSNGTGRGGEAMHRDEATRGDADYRVYYSKTADGRPLRAVTMVIRNGTRPIGMLCINFDLTVPLHEILRTFAPISDSEAEREDSPEHYMMSAEDLVTRSLDLAIQKATAQRGVSPQAKNRAIVGELHRQGIFDIKGAVEMVSAELGVSRFTVYNYLRDLKNDGETHEDE